MHPSLRLPLAVLLLPLSLGLGLAALAAPGHLDPWASTGASIVVLAALAGLGVGGTPQAPLRPARLAFGAASVICGFLLLGFRYPPMPRDVFSALLIGAGFLLSVATLLLVGSHPNWARALAAPLALYGLLMLVDGVRTAMEYSNATESFATTISRALVLMLAGAWIAGLWHLRSVARHRPPAGSVAERTRRHLGAWVGEHWSRKR